MGKTPAQRAAKHGDKAQLPAGAQVPANPTTQRTPQQAKTNANLVVIAAAATALFMFWYYHLLVLDQMTQLSGGLAMPDSLIGGYDMEYLAALRSALDADALGQLSYVHKTAGTLFPLIFGFAWLLIIGLNTRRRSLRWVLWAFPILFVIADLWENVAIDGVLGSAELAAGDAGLASILTVARWVLLGLSLVASVFAVFSARPGRPPELVTEDKH
ncbi:hypothetical protein FYJ28_07245 [Arthrobacter sp. BL-252-APC-1A]|uniref:hypothetical protein n=1 Tax=Arthrobacter sp. BL-252-APC-1A TaxID=2606622 RepID=UPI0012B35189|nr:hypothetical protein [Arthrobacter sp. BL-252-APC-1A]MSR98621.1 hypothetical protein [Arthrobacter sp. BL-252-APC-1A]